ncbi:colorectal cancer-associated protein 2 [Arapaima gigas]
MSDKPKVYQGVRVKAPVKELLQKQRARQAAIKNATISQSFTIPDVCSTPITAHHFDVCSGSPMADAAFQPPPYGDYIPMETTPFDSPQPMNVMLPADNFASALPQDSSAQHWSHGHYTSSSDYYSNSMVACSSPDPLLLSLSSPVDYNSYSPPDSYSSSSSCYNSPTRLDSGYGFTPDNYHFQHCSMQHSYCLSPWTTPQDGASNPEYAPYYESDCLFTPVEQSYFRRDVGNSDMCYI